MEEKKETGSLLHPSATYLEPEPIPLISSQQLLGTYFVPGTSLRTFHT